MKVFCSPCKWLLEFTLNGAQCNYPQNVTKNVTDTWYEEVPGVIFKRHPSEINTHNDCPWFEKRDVCPDMGGWPAQEKKVPPCGHTVPIFGCPSCCQEPFHNQQQTTSPRTRKECILRGGDGTGLPICPNT